MKKLFAACCITFCLLFSGAVNTVQADGNGHDGGRQCTETVNCPPDNPLIQPPPPDLPSDSTDEATTAEDTFLTLLELIIGLLP